MDFYYGNFKNGVSGSLCSMNGLPGEVVAFLQGEENPDKRLDYEHWKNSTSVVFTDDDPEGVKAYESYSYRLDRNSLFALNMVLPNMNRDTANEKMYGEQVYLTIPPCSHTEKIRGAGIQIHQLAGYYDQSSSFHIAAANAWNEGTVVFGPWTHLQTLSCKADPEIYPNNEFDMRQDYLRWFDYLLKDKDNGYDQAPRFYYYLVGAEPGMEWRYSDSMHPHNCSYMDLYLNDSRKLGTDSPAVPSKTPYRVDTSISMPADYCWHTIYTAEPMNDCVDAKACVFTAEPAEKDFDIVGIPTIDMWVSCENSNDADFLVYLEIVNEDGESHYLSRAYMRASHRTSAADPLWDSTAGLAGRYHSSMTEDVEACLKEGLKEPVLLRFEFDMVSRRIKKGQSLRVSVTCANTASCQHYMYYEKKDGIYVEKPKDQLPLINICTGAEHASFISIPVMKDEENVFKGQLQADGTSSDAVLYRFKDTVCIFSSGCWKKYPLKECIFDGNTVYLGKEASFIRNGEAFCNGIAIDQK